MLNKVPLLIFIIISCSTLEFAQDKFRNAVLLHHSTGARFYNYYEFDENYNGASVPLATNQYNINHNYSAGETVSFSERWFPETGAGQGNDWYDWHFILDDNDPVEPDDHDWFYSLLDTFKVIVIKSCFYSSDMDGWGNDGGEQDTSGAAIAYKTVQTYKWHWRSMIDIFKNHPDNFFVLWTNMPRVQNMTNPTAAYLSHLFSTWAKDTLAAGLDTVYGELPENVYVFDLFHKVANQNYYFPDNYSEDLDGHPNGIAANLLSPQIVQEIFDAAISYETGTEYFQLSVPIQDGWNMVSVPGLQPDNQNVNTWWINKDPSASVFNFDGTYNSVNTVTHGIGYMMKHNGDQIYNTGDEWPANGIKVVPNNPISVTAGWNLIGGYENTVPVSTVSTIPEGLFNGSIFGYSTVGGYQIADSLKPGLGYWIRVSNDGVLNFTTPAAKMYSTNSNSVKEDWGKIIITDSKSRRYTLYTVTDNSDLRYFDLPPTLPDGFDVRFSTGRFAERIDGTKEIKIQGADYPISLRIQGTSIRIEDESGKMFNQFLNDGEEIKIQNPLNKLMVKQEIINDNYYLEQNYPNPFNPTTTICFAIPNVGTGLSASGGKSYVTLKVYDVLGNEVATLVNEYKEAGMYNVQFTMNNLPAGWQGLASGIYFYTLKAGDFTQTRKMLLMK